MAANLPAGVHDTLKAIANLQPNQNKPTDPANRLNYLATMPSMPSAVIPATNRSDAQLQARLEPRRPDPFAPLIGSKAFPKQRKPVHEEGQKNSKLPLDFGNGPAEGLPPPPPDSTTAGMPPILPPAPPPMTDTTASGIAVDELPLPPEKPLLIPRLKLNAILGDHVVITFKDNQFRKSHGFKKYITLAPGQEFDSIKLIDVSNNSATLEENGEQKTVTMDPIK